MTHGLRKDRLTPVYSAYSGGGHAVTALTGCFLRDGTGVAQTGAWRRAGRWSVFHIS